MKKLHYHVNPKLGYPTSPRPTYWKSLDEIAKWKVGTDEQNVAKVDLKPRPEFRGGTSQKEKDKRECRVVVCHDMAGGNVINCEIRET